MPPWEESVTDLDLVELFAGVGRIARLGAWMGYRTRAFDLNYMPLKDPLRRKGGKFQRPPMDLNGSAGLVPLDSNHNLNINSFGFVWCIHDVPVEPCREAVYL